MSRSIRLSAVTAIAALAAGAVLGLATKQSLGQQNSGQQTLGRPPAFSGEHPSVPYTTPTYAPAAGGGIVFPASTVIEGYGRAKAGVIKARADYELSHAQARILHAEAKAREYQLRVINTTTFLDRKQLLNEARDAERYRKYQNEQLAYARRQQREQTVLRDAYRLPLDQFDRETGKIAWPATMKRVEFTDATETLDTLFAQLAEEGPQYDRLFRDPISDTIADARQQLNRNRETLGVDWQDYLACQKLLVGLKYEAEHWSAAPAPATVASR